MASKELKENIANKLEWLRLRWWHSLLIHLFWPAMLLGSIYVGSFFFVNSQPFVDLVEAQVNGQLMGTIEIDDVTIGPFLNRLNVNGARLYEPEGSQVIGIEHANAKVPALELLGIFTRGQLDLNDIEVDQADVFLDFRAYEKFNLLRAVEPVKEVDSTGDPLTLAFHDVNFRRSRVHLAFDGFDVELKGTDLNGFTVKVGSFGLEISTRPIPDTPAIAISEGQVLFEPRLFNFPMGEHGRPEVGLPLAVPSGRAAYVAALQRQTAVALSNTFYHFAEASKLPTELLPREIRGNLVIPFRNAKFSDFWWRGLSYGALRFDAEVSDGRVQLKQFAMNLAPTADDIARDARAYGHTPSSTPPEETILFHAGLEMTLPGNDPALAYFIGSDLRSEVPLNILLDASGDLGHAEAHLTLTTDSFNYAGYRVDDVTLVGALDGQDFALLDLSASALTGAIGASGHYAILDGDFDFELNLGEVDPDRNFERVEGVDGSLVVGTNLANLLAGEVTGLLQVVGHDDAIELFLKEPLTLELANALPLSGARSVLLRQNNPTADEPLLSWKYRVLRLHDGFSVVAGEDRLKIARGLAFWLDALTVEGLQLELTTDNLGRYAKVLGLGDLRTSEVALKVSGSGPIFNADAEVELDVSGLHIAGIDAPTLQLSARHHRGKVTIERFQAETSLGKVSASGTLKPFRTDFRKLDRNPQVDLKVNVKDFDLRSLNELLPDLGLEAYALKGVVQTDVAVTGKITDPRLRGQARIDGFGVMQEEIPLFQTHFDVALDRIAVSDLFVNFGEPRRDSPSSAREYSSLAVTQASYNLNNRKFAVDMALEGLYLKDIKRLQAAGLDLSGVIDLTLKASGDLDGWPQEPIIAEGTLTANNLVYAERELGDVTLDLTGSADGLDLKGKVFGIFGFQARVEQQTDFSAVAKLTFDNLDLLDALPELATAINGAPKAHQNKFQNNANQIMVAELDASGAVEASFDNTSGLVARLRLSQIGAVVYGQTIRTRGETLLTFRDQDKTLEINHLELRHSAKSLMLSGTAGLDGKIDLELNGEVSAELARLGTTALRETEGSLGIALTAQGDIYDEKTQSLDLYRAELGGFVGVRQPIRVLVRGLPDPILLSRGIIEVTSGSRCRNSPQCFRISLGKAFEGELLGGDYTLYGEVGRTSLFPQSADLKVSARDLSYRVKNEMTLTFSPNNLHLEIEDFADPNSWELSGIIEVTEGRYYKDYDVQGELVDAGLGTLIESRARAERYESPVWDQVPLLKQINLDIVVAAERGFKVDNKVAGADVNVDLTLFARVQGHLPPSELDINGVVNVREGKVLFRTVEFDVLPGGNLRFDGPLAQASLNLAAQAEINTQSNFTSTVMGRSTLDRQQIKTQDLAQGSSNVTITVSVTGTLSEPVIEFESQPNKSDNDILALILTGKTIDDLNTGAESPAMDFALQSLIAPFFEAQVGDILAADQLKFVIKQGAAQFVYVQQVNRSFRIGAGVIIRGAEGNEQALSSEYRFTDRWLVELTGQNTIVEEGKAPIPRFDARVRFHIPLD